jgi:hypothetical protein
MAPVFSIHCFAVRIVLFTKPSIKGREKGMGKMARKVNRSPSRFIVTILCLLHPVPARDYSSPPNVTEQII